MTQELEKARYIFECARKQPRGGQHVGSENGVRVTDTFTGNIAECHSEWSQHKNRLKAIEMLEWASA